MELFSVVKSLSCLGLQEENVDHSAAHCEQFAQYFADKITSLCSNLDVIIDAVPVDATLALTCPVIMDTFQLMQAKNEDRVLGEVKTTTCIDCPSQLI